MKGNAYKLGHEGQKAVVLIFIDPECPVSVYYASKMNALAELADSLNISYYGLFSSPYLDMDKAASFIRDYRIEFGVLMDAKGQVAKALGPEVVPEVYIINAENRLIYKGAINNEFAALGKRREAGITEYVEDILSQSEFYKVIHPFTYAVGCIFEPWD